MHASDKPNFLMDMIPKLPLEAGAEWEGAVTLDLSYSRLGTMTAEQLRELVRALKQRPWLRVRLGHEVMPLRVVEALEAEGWSEAWGGQVCVDRPWDPTNKLLADAVAELAASTRALIATHHNTAKDTVTESDASKCGVPSMWEHQMAEGVRARVGGEIVAVSHTWPGSSEDLDCLVAGTLEGQPVVVIGEAKVDMPSEVDEALRQLARNATRWSLLIGYSQQDAEE
eukprot:CAMPEP_0202893504 /NCGR_PEP_ID=MMETSP1392-20130828/3074_1 /ASSEMBLY_ACC=CAM_ASM_000868 /TAXON_ID=225041 /ORGANISM="Chlamydomonas chlamydogama, Strain SAG 11-48b" /LENGTH=226 /DNA_ID=CAMNT_0049577861 /DNA_START=347 /DNA_END=1024 /DNA_ORIENTATION=-